MLFSKTVAQSEIQYGDFISSPENINWNEVERETRRLLDRTKDIRVMILLLRCKIQLNNAVGLLEGLTWLYQSLQTWADNIHPQLITDDETTREESQIMRSNALTSLIDPQGVLSDIRNIVLASNTALRLQVRDVERALSIPHPVDALAADSVRRQLAELRLRTPETMMAFDHAAIVIEQIAHWCKTTLNEFSPDLSLLSKIVGLIQDGAQYSAKKSALHELPSPHSEASSEEVSKTSTEQSLIDEITPSLPLEVPLFDSLAVSHAAIIQNRNEAQEHIRKVRVWFEINEPSSSVVPLLRQAERMVGKRFSEVFDAIPQELLQKWDSEETI